MAKLYRVAVIGRTGRGNYGHNLDLAWKTHPRARIVAVADDNPEGLKKAAARLEVSSAYGDYRKMLDAERPEIVVIASRWVDAHLEMALAAASAGASIFMEKPMARTLAECDRMLDACDRAHVKLSVAHNMRVCPLLDAVQQRIAEGLIGDLHEIRGRGKEDRRAGGEDLMVLGTHTFDLMRRFAGDPVWAFGRVSAAGRPLTRSDIRADAPEGLGWVAGDSISGAFGFAGALTGYFTSRRSEDTSGRRWGLDLYGTRGAIAIRAGYRPEVTLSRSPTWSDGVWEPLPIPENTPPKDERAAYHLMIDDLLEAIERDHQPQACGRTARWTMEMAHALYWSELQGARVRLPLAGREHPLAAWPATASG